MLPLPSLIWRVVANGESIDHLQQGPRQQLGPFDQWILRRLGHFEDLSQPVAFLDCFPGGFLAKIQHLGDLGPELLRLPPTACRLVDCPHWEAAEVVGPVVSYALLDRIGVAGLPIVGEEHENARH